jgi:hypothetical protein
MSESSAEGSNRGLGIIEPWGPKTSFHPEPVNLEGPVPFSRQTPLSSGPPATEWLIVIAKGLCAVLPPGKQIWPA